MPALTIASGDLVSFEKEIVVTVCNAVRFIGTKTENAYGDATGMIWLNNVRCRGRETNIFNCSHDEYGIMGGEDDGGGCNHHDDVAIFCSTGIDLHVSYRFLVK